MKYLLPVVLLLISGCGKDEFALGPKRCSFCFEEVKRGARACKHCSRDPYDGDHRERSIDLKKLIIMDREGFKPSDLDEAYRDDADGYDGKGDDERDDERDDEGDDEGWLKPGTPVWQGVLLVVIICFVFFISLKDELKRP